jgi:hypothetical protein
VRQTAPSKGRQLTRSRQRATRSARCRARGLRLGAQTTEMLKRRSTAATRGAAGTQACPRSRCRAPSECVGVPRRPPPLYRLWRQQGSGASRVSAQAERCERRCFSSGSGSCRRRALFAAAARSAPAPPSPPVRRSGSPATRACNSAPLGVAPAARGAAAQTQGLRSRSREEHAAVTAAVMPARRSCVLLHAACARAARHGAGESVQRPCGAANPASQNARWRAHCHAPARVQPAAAQPAAAATARRGGEEWQLLTW